MKFELRNYQEQAISKMLWDIDNPGNSVVSLPQGSGKSLVITGFAHKLGIPILILQPSKELLQQNVEKMLHYVDENKVGIFSASMKRKDTNTFTFATIQSAYKHPELFTEFNIAIIDEGDLVPIKKLSSMYQKFFRMAGIKKCFGLTGTPFRQDTYYEEPAGGWAAWKMRRWKDYKSLEVVTTTKIIVRYKEMFWSRMLCVVNTHELIPEYLCPLRYLDQTILKHEDIPTNITKSEFDLKTYEEMILPKEQIIVEGILKLQKDHKSILVFCSSVDQANRLSQTFPQSSTLSALTPLREREKIVADFKTGVTTTLFNVSILTVGFDHPDLDCIVLARPTRSLRLHLQILGRGTRKSEGKTFCDVIDYAGNVKALGKLEEIKVERINGAWNVTSPSFRDGFHMKKLFTYKIKPPTYRDKSPDQEVL